MGDFVFELDNIPNEDLARAVVDLSNTILNGEYVIDGTAVSPTLNDDILVRAPGGEVIEGDIVCLADCISFLEVMHPHSIYTLQFHKHRRRGCCCVCILFYILFHFFCSSYRHRGVHVL